jgi:amino-acid N-acetyltransferase
MSPSDPQPAAIRKARMDDVEIVHSLVTEFSREQFLLGRSRAELYESLRDFQVAEIDGQVVGCAALTIAWKSLAEIRSLATAREVRGRGIGRRLVEACLAEARGLGIGRVFALTQAPPFFERIGFRRVPKEELPHKIWADCIKCPKFPDCDEEAVAIDL